MEVGEGDRVDLLRGIPESVRPDAVEGGGGIGNDPGVESESPAMRAVVEMQWLVVSPAMTRVWWAAARSSASSVVPMKPQFTRFSITRSSGLGAASTLNAFPGWSGRKGEAGSVDMCFTWMIGRLLERQASSSSATRASIAGLFRLPHFGASNPCWTSTTSSKA